MDLETLVKMLGEWVGKGSTTFPMNGRDITASLEEYLRIEKTDNENVFAYIRKSTIDGGPRGSLLHNEMGYFTAAHAIQVGRIGKEIIVKAGTKLLLSRGSVIIMEWDGTSYVQIEESSSKDTISMRREISYNDQNDTMSWNNTMKVDKSEEQDGSKFVPHSVSTDFKRINP